MKNKAYFNWAICSFILLSLSACAPMTQGGFMGMYAKQSNGEIIGNLVVMNQNEIDKANLAMKKASNRSVRQYAAYLAQQHRNCLHKTRMLSRQIGAPAETDRLAQSLKSQGQQQLLTLNQLRGKAFDQAYIAAVIEDHKVALRLIDKNFMKNSTSPMLTKHLNTVRQHIHTHLQKAMAIQKTLQG